MDPLSLLSWVSGAIDTQLSTVVSWATAGFNTLTNNLFGLKGVLDSFIDWVKGALGSLITWLDSLWVWLRDHVINRLRDLIQRIKDKIAKIVKPLKKIIDDYRRMLQQIWQTYVKPLYDFIQRLRKVLVLFRLLGFKWAKQLDARLVEIENAISAAFLAVWGNLNALSTWINWILDPFGLLQPSLYLGSLIHSVSTVIAILQRKPLRDLTSQEKEQNDQDAGYYHRPALERRAAQPVNIAVLPEDQLRLARLQQAYQDLGFE